VPNLRRTVNSYIAVTPILPSVATGRIITTEPGASTVGRAFVSINGWKFWQVVCKDGKARTLADLREQLISGKGATE
jgi:hypothetical protein